MAIIIGIKPNFRFWLINSHLDLIKRKIGDDKKVVRGLWLYCTLGREKPERNVRLSASQELNWGREEKLFFDQRRRQEFSSLAKETRLGELENRALLYII